MMEAAVRAFEDWEFQVLEQESGIDEEDESAMEEEKEGESAGHMEKEISRQQHGINIAQVNNRRNKEEFFSEIHSCSRRVIRVRSLSACHVLHVSVYPRRLTWDKPSHRLVTSGLCIEQVDKITVHPTL